MAVALVQHPVLPNVFDLVVDDTYGWRMPASWWRAQTRGSLSAIGADDLGASVEAVLAAIERALPSDVARAVSELRQAAGLPADYPYTHELVALKEWIETHRKVSGMMTLSDRQDLDAFRAKAASVRKQLEPSDYEAPDATIVGTLHHWLGELLGKRPATEADIEQLELALSSLRTQVEKMSREEWRTAADGDGPTVAALCGARERLRVLEDAGHWEPLLRESLKRVLRAVTGKADVSSMVGEIGTPGFDTLIEQLRWDCSRSGQRAQAKSGAALEEARAAGDVLWREVEGRNEQARACNELATALAEARTVGDDLRRQLRVVCAAVLGIKVSEVDADPDVEAVIADMWKAPRRAVAEALFGRLLADLGAEASRVLGAAPTDLVYSADHKDDTVIGRIGECIRDSEMLRKRGLQRIDPAAPPPVTNAADEIKRLRALVDRQGNELGELRKVVGGPTDLELRRMICQDLVWRGDTIARQEHQIESLRSDLREVEAALHAEQERAAEVSLAAQQEIQRTRERVDGVLSRVVSVENVQRMHDLFKEATDADDHVTQLLSRYTDLAGGIPDESYSEALTAPTKLTAAEVRETMEFARVLSGERDVHTAALLDPNAARVLEALHNLTAIMGYTPMSGATINVSGLPGRGVWVRDEGLQYVPGILPARLGRTFKFMSPLSARPIICTWLGEFAVYDGVRLAPVYLPDEVPAFDPTVVPTAPFDHPEERESNHTAARRNNSESPIDDLAETLRATRQDAAELETEVARLEVELQAWRTWPSGHV